MSQFQQQSINLVTKYGIKFYSFLISQILVLSVILRTHQGGLALSFVSFFNLIGSILPIKHVEQTHISKFQNKNNYLLGPLILSCLSTPIILLIAWKNYHQIISDSFTDNLQLMLALAFITSGSIDAAHELLHRPQFFCKAICYINLFFMQFTIYPTQHLYLHHKKVGTPEDPITSPKNQSLYKYYIKALLSCYKFNWGYSKKIFSFNLGSTIIYNVLLFLYAYKQGSCWKKAAFFSTLSYLTLFIMQSVQYIEHYGLVYRKNVNEKQILEISSWNTTENQLLNWFIFKFQRHSDHHMNAYKIYTTLDLTEKMPQFPFDFVTGIVISVFSPIWFKMVNPLVDQVVENKPIEKSHLQFVNLLAKITRFILLGMFPLRLAQYIYS